MKHITLDTNAYSALTNGDLAAKEVTGFADIVWVANSVLITYDRHFLNLESLHIWEKLS